MKTESKKDYEELKPVDDTGSVGGGGSYGNPQPQKPNKDWMKWAVIGFIAVVIALIITSVL